MAAPRHLGIEHASPQQDAHEIKGIGQVVKRRGCFRRRFIQKLACEVGEFSPSEKKQHARDNCHDIQNRRSVRKGDVKQRERARSDEPGGEQRRSETFGELHGGNAFRRAKHYTPAGILGRRVLPP